MLSDLVNAIQSIAKAIQDAFGSGMVTLGYLEKVTDFTTTSTSYVDVTGVTLTVIVPGGGRRVKIDFEPQYAAVSVTGIGATFAILCDGVVIREKAFTSPGAGYAVPFKFSATHIPSAGSHVYKLQAKTGANTLTIKCDASPAFASFQVSQV